MNKFDKIFKHKLSHAHSEVGAHNWDKIASRLDQADAIKPRVWPYRLALTGLAILLLIVGATWLSKSIHPNNIVNTLVNSSHNSPNLGETYSSIINQSTSSSSTNINRNIVMDAAPLSAQNRNSLVNDDIETSDTPKLALAGDRHLKTQSATLNTSIFTPTVNYANQTSEIESSLTSSSSLLVTPLEGGNIDPIVTKDHNLIFPLVAINDTKILKLPKFNYSQSTLLTFGRKVKSKPSSKTIPACPFSLDGHNKSIEFYISHDYIDKSLSSLPELANIVTIRKDSESAMYSFSAGFRFGYTVAPRFNLHLGANYSRMNEKFSYVDPESVQERTITIKDYIYENGKIVDSVVTTEIVKLPGTSTIKKQNSYTSFDIPLLCRFTILGNRNLSLSALAGPIVNVSYGHKGMIIGNDSQPIDISSNQVYKPQLGVRLYGGVSLAYHLAGDLDFVFEPHARISFEDVSKDNYPIAQRHQTFGIHTGLRYKF